MSERLLAQRDRLMDEVCRLETSLKNKCAELSSISSNVDIDQDLQMIKRMRELLLALKQEHEELVKTIERSASYAKFEEPRWAQKANNFPLKSTGDLDDLVRRVQEAVGDAPRTPEFKRIFTDRYPVERTPPEITIAPESEHLGELSIASKQYLKKYGLLPPSPKQRPAHHGHQTFRPSRLQDRYDEGPLESPTKYRKASRYGREENDRILPSLF